jgi:hypothetical protein
MLKEDEERLEREASIIAAKRGPDYTWLENSIARNKAKARELANLQAEYNAKSRTPTNNEGAFEDVARQRSITQEHAARNQYASSKARKLTHER